MPYSCGNQFACFSIHFQRRHFLNPHLPKMRRPLLGEITAEFGLSAPRSLISCGKTSESTCRAAITQALGALSGGKMDLEAICGQSPIHPSSVFRTITRLRSWPGFLPPLLFFSSPLLPPFLFCFVLSAAIVDGCKKT